VVKCQETRSRDQNRQIARRILADKLEHHLTPEFSRVALKTEVAAKKKASRLKKSRRKYRKLAEEKGDKEKETIEIPKSVADPPV
jgi:protein subunit release factor B